MIHTLRSQRVLACACLFVLSVTTAAAWSATGHMIIATIAYRDLSPQLQKKYLTILASHPDFQVWKGSYKGNLDEGAYLFMRASVWADELKKDRGNPETHAAWHYINMPLIPPAFPLRDAPKPTAKGDIMTAIALNRDVLASASARVQDRAVALAWLIHLIGDLHQPLHTTALIVGAYKAPYGDKGGNGFYVRPSERAKKPISLHVFWDGLLGTSKNYGAAYREALLLEREHARSSMSEFLQRSAPRDWMLESRQIAIDEVYLRGTLRGSSKRTTPASVVPPSYRSNAKAIAERRAALAGYRLGALLTHL